MKYARKSTIKIVGRGNAGKWGCCVSYWRFMIFIKSHDFYPIFHRTKKLENSDGIFTQKFMRKKYFYLIYERRLSFDFLAGETIRRPLALQRNTQWHSAEPPWRGYRAIIREGFRRLQRLLYRGGYGPPNAYSIMRERKRRAGSRALRRSAVTLLLIIIFLLSCCGGGVPAAADKLQ